MAVAAGVEPWAVTIALLATSVVCFLPFQTSALAVPYWRRLGIL